MKKIMICFFILHILIFNNKADGQDVKIIPLSLEQAKTKAKQNNPLVLNAKIDFEISKNNIEIADALRNPKIVSDIIYGRVSRGNTNQVGILFPVEIAKRGVRKDIAKDLSDIKELEMLKLTQQTEYKVYNAYFLRLTEKNQNLLELEHFNYLLEKNFENEEYKDLLINKQKNFYEKIKEKENQSVKNFNKILNNFSRETVYDVKEIDIFNINIYRTPVLDTSETDKKILNKQIDAAKKNIKLEKHRRIPDIEFGGGFAFEYGDKWYDHNNVGGFFSFDFNLPSLNLFGADIRNAELQYEKAKLKKYEYEESAQNIYEEYIYEFTLLKNNFEEAKKNLIKYKNTTNKEIMYSVKKDYLDSLYEIFSFYSAKNNI